MSTYKLSLIEIENLGPIDRLRVDWQLGDILVFKGRNGTGKTTATSHLSQLLQNASMPEPLKKGAQQGYFKAVLKDGEGKDTEILHKFDQEGQTLTVIAPNGHEMGNAASKTFLSKLAQDKRSFYIPDYLEVSAPQKRMEMILKLIPLELANVIAGDSKALKEARDKRQKAFQDVTLQKGKAVVYSEELAVKEPLSPVTLANQKQAILDHNAKYAQAITGKEAIEANVGNIQANMTKKEAEIKRLQAELEQLKQDEFQQLQRIDAADEWLADEANKPKPTDEIDAIDTQLANLNEENEKISNAKRIKSEHARLKELQSVYDDHDFKCKEAETALRVKMTEAKLPANLSIEINEDAVLSLNLGNVPLEQSSSSERTIAQLHLSLASMGELGFVRFDGTLVDDSNMADVMKWLKEHQYQAAIEIMERSGGGTVTYEVADKYFQLGENVQGAESADQNTTLFT